MRLALLFSFLFLIFCMNACYTNRQDEQKEAVELAFLNLGDSAHEVGIETCKNCHADKFSTFIHTGMGSSFGPTSRQKSSADFSTHPVVYDAYSDFYYSPFFQDEQLYIKEFRLEGKDTIHQLVQAINYIVGSGQHTNSHLFQSGKYLFQAPLTWYAQKKKWDLPPGFEKGMNTRFSRKIGYECMTCHNAYSQHVEGSDNAYEEIPHGINCERCHGPGSIHVRRKMAGEIIDTSKYADYSIVNPKRLSPDLQFEICQRCHLQGNAVLNVGKSFADFRPGMRLNEIMTVFLPRYKGREDEFIMASHADRMKMSKCYTSSKEKSFNCITCHNPHVSVKQTGKEHFNQKCLSCHGEEKPCPDPASFVQGKAVNCTSCHMPESGSVDIPHVSVHDHYIRKPLKKKELDEIKQFIGLAAINHPAPPPLSRAEAYLNQYEKFDRQPYMLDSCLNYLNAHADKKSNPDWIPLWVRYFFLKEDYRNLMAFAANHIPGNNKPAFFQRRDPENRDAYTAYRIGEAFMNAGNHAVALNWFRAAVRLAPGIPEFSNKLAASMMSSGQKTEAKKIYDDLVDEHPYFYPAYSNLGYLLYSEGKQKEAHLHFDKALQLNPDYENGVLNKANALLNEKRYKEAGILLQRFLKRHPQSAGARQLLSFVP
jgi:tetratricopeptide (TPR) repeat protein